MEHARTIAAVHTYPAREIYTMISGGQPTEVGTRGYPAVQTIIAAGARNQRTDEAPATVYGDAARGLDRSR